MDQNVQDVGEICPWGEGRLTGKYLLCTQTSALSGALVYVLSCVQLTWILIA